MDMAGNLTECIRNLAWDSLIRFRETDRKNALILSPLSITVAIGMLAGAGDDKVQAQLCKKLGVSDSTSMSSAFQTMQEILVSSTEISMLELANGIFAQDDLKIADDYVDYLHSLAAQFTRYPSLAKETERINEWISNKTRERIVNMLKPDMLSNAEVLIINAIAFTGKWQQEFDKKHTMKDAPFYVTPDTIVNVDLMFQYNTEVLVQDFERCTAVRLPYAEDSGPAMFFEAYLPSSDKELDSILPELKKHDAVTFTSIKVTAFGLPKFRSETFKDLTSLLDNLGYPLHGSWPGLFSGEHNSNAFSVLHKAMIEVDEVGTKAAAATVILSRGYRPPPPTREKIIFNKPFAYCIVDEYRNVLFSGIYTMPGED